MIKVIASFVGTSAVALMHYVPREFASSTQSRGLSSHTSRVAHFPNTTKPELGMLPLLNSWTRGSWLLESGIHQTPMMEITASMVEKFWYFLVMAHAAVSFGRLSCRQQSPLETNAPREHAP